MSAHVKVFGCRPFIDHCCPPRQGRRSKTSKEGNRESEGRRRRATYGDLRVAGVCCRAVGMTIKDAEKGMSDRLNPDGEELRGLHGALDQTGGVLGPLIVGAALYLKGGYQGAFDPRRARAVRRSPFLSASARYRRGAPRFDGWPFAAPVLGLRRCRGLDRGGLCRLSIDRISFRQDRFDRGGLTGKVPTRGLSVAVPHSTTIRDPPQNRQRGALQQDGDSGERRHGPVIKHAEQTAPG